MCPQCKAGLLNLIKRFLPETYKSIFFKKLKHLNWTNIKNQNIENELLLIGYILDKQSVFIDVGANLGQYVYMAGKQVAGENIFAFEPNPSLNKRLKHLFKQVHVVQAALSSEQGTFKFKIPIFKDREIHTRGTLKTEHTETEETSFNLISVQALTLDAYVQSQAIDRVSLIKIDVEGAEFDVLKGADSVIREKRPAIIVEIEQRHHATAIKDFILTFEKQYAYRTYYFDSKSQELKDDIAAQKIDNLQSEENHAKNRLFVNNFIFLPKEQYTSAVISEIQEKIKSGL